MHFLHYSLCKSVKLFTTGSTVEIPSNCKMIAEKFDVNVGMLDTDIMLNLRDLRDLPISEGDIVGTKRCV